MNQTEHHAAVDEELKQFDEELQHLALSIQQSPPSSQDRQATLGNLISLILQSGRLCRPQRGQFSGLYDDIYDEAIQELLLFVCQNFDKYDPKRGSVMTWVNMLLERRFFREAIPRVLDNKEIRRISLDEIDYLPFPEKIVTPMELLEEYIEADPEHLFRRTCIKNLPKANFQIIAKRRIAGASWEEISEEFNLSISTISSFFYRCLGKFTPKLKAYCLDSVSHP